MEMLCRKHPLSPSVGICPYCLKDRLVKLVCSDCGEQRLSSCSCSDVSSSTTMEVGSVGRVSFLIENQRKLEDKVVILRRSNSSCVEVKKRNGFWRLLRKKRRSSPDVSRSRSVTGGGDEGSEYGLSSAKISDVTAVDSGRPSGFFSESEATKSGSYLDESGFIDLKLDMMSDHDFGSRSVKRGNKVWKWILAAHKIKR